MKRRIITILTAIMLLLPMTFAMGCKKEDPNKTLYVWSVYPLYAGYEMQLTIDPSHPYALYTKFIVEKFKEKYPDFTIKVVDKGWGDALNENIMRSMFGGETPDLVGTEVYNQNYISQDYFAKLNLTEEEKNNYIPSPLIGNYGGGSSGKTGDLYATPLMTGVFSLAYNEQMMMDAGCPKIFNEETEKFELLVPETWAEVLYCCELLNDYLNKTYSGVNREAYGAYVINNVKGVASAFRAQTFMRQAGGDFMTEEAVGTVIDASKLAINSEANKDAFTMMSMLGMYTPKNSYALSGTAAETAITNYMKQGKVAMSVEFPAFTKDLDADYIKFAKIPQFTNGDNFLPFEYSEDKRDPAERRTASNVLVANICAGIPKKSTKYEQSKYLVELMLSDESQELLLKMDMRMPVTKSGMNSILNSTDAKVIDNRTRLKPFLEDLKNTYAENPIGINGGLPCFKQNVADIWTEYQILATKMYNPTDSYSVTGLRTGKTDKNYNMDGAKTRQYISAYLATFAENTKKKL